MSIPQRVDPGAVDAPATLVLDLTLVDARPAMKPERHRAERINEVALIRDVWYLPARARSDDAPRTLAAAQDAVFRRYLPMARTLANGSDAGSRPVDPAAAVQAAELGLARAVLGWRRPYSAGFELFAHIAIAAQLDRLPTAPPRRSAGSPPPRCHSATGDQSADAG